MATRRSPHTAEARSQSGDGGEQSKHRARQKVSTERPNDSSLRLENARLIQFKGPKVLMSDPTVNGTSDASFSLVVEMQKLVEDLGHDEETEDNGFEVFVGKVWKGAEDRFHLGAETSADFASELEVYFAPRVGFSGA